MHSWYTTCAAVSQALIQVQSPRHGHVEIAATIDGCRRLLRASLNQAVRSELLFRDPAAGADKPSNGQPINHVNLHRQLKSLLRKADLPNIRFHDLRYTHATLLLQAGVHPKIVQERLGHSSISMTMDIYSHVFPHMQSQASNQISEILSIRKSTESQTF